jgi:hypothetical protein
MASGTCSQYVTQCAQRSFAPGGLTPFIALTTSCASPKPLPGFAFTLAGQSLQLRPSAAGLGNLPDVMCREPFLGCLDPYPGSLSDASTRFFSLSFGLPATVTRSAVWRQPVRRLQYGPFFRGLQSFLNVQASKFACHPGRSYRRRFLVGAAVTFTSEHRACRYLHARRIC